MKTIENIRQRLMNGSIEVAKFAAKPFYQPAYWPFSHEDLFQMPKGSIGNDLAHYLDSHGFRLVEKYELHDVKHILLGYEMDTIGEIRLQFYLFGNGNQTLPVILSMAFGLCIIPEHFITFYRDLKRGEKAKPISELDYSVLVLENTKQVQQNLNILEGPMKEENVGRWVINTINMLPHVFTSPKTHFPKI